MERQATEKSFSYHYGTIIRETTGSSMHRTRISAGIVVVPFSLFDF